ncbi:flocculation protein FLO11-like [Leptopilina heterotoma]|uniref:flocculation protein FLO11-like n=1 Tax=Leptopilina heterotoma TaxID=63436 RepID=UPI001CA9C595|nr:flocculation protein FLO11-like [Leptopilina heterotoma]
MILRIKSVEFRSKTRFLEREFRSTIQQQQQRRRRRRQANSRRSRFRAKVRGTFEMFNVYLVGEVFLVNPFDGSSFYIESINENHEVGLLPSRELMQNKETVVKALDPESSFKCRIQDYQGLEPLPTIIPRPTTINILLTCQIYKRENMKMNLFLLFNFYNFFLLINCQNFFEKNQGKMFLTLDDQQSNKNNNYDLRVNEKDLNEAQNLSAIIQSNSIPKQMSEDEKQFEKILKIDKITKDTLRIIDEILNNYFPNTICEQLKNEKKFINKDEIFHVIRNFTECIQYLSNSINNNSNDDDELRNLTISTVNLIKNLISLIVDNCKNDTTSKSEEINSKCYMSEILRSIVQTLDDFNQLEEQNSFYEEILTVFEEENHSTQEFIDLLCNISKIFDNLGKIANDYEIEMVIESSNLGVEFEEEMEKILEGISNNTTWKEIQSFLYEEAKIIGTESRSSSLWQEPSSTVSATGELFSNPMIRTLNLTESSTGKLFLNPIIRTIDLTESTTRKLFLNPTEFTTTETTTAEFTTESTTAEFTTESTTAEFTTESTTSESTTTKLTITEFVHTISAPPINIWITANFSNSTKESATTPIQNSVTRAELDEASFIETSTKEIVTENTANGGPKLTKSDMVVTNNLEDKGKLSLAKSPTKSVLESNDKTLDQKASVTESNDRTYSLDQKASVTESNHKTYPMDRKASVTESNHKTYLMGQKASVTESNHKTYPMDKKASVTESNHKTYPIQHTNPLTTEPTTTAKSDLIVNFKIRDHPNSTKDVLSSATSNFQGGITTPREIQTITPVPKTEPLAITRTKATTGIIPKKSISNVLSITTSKLEESSTRGNPTEKMTKHLDQKASVTESNDKTYPMDRKASVTESNDKTQPIDRMASVTESNHKTYPMDQKASVTESNHKTYLMGQKASVTESNDKTYPMDRKASVTESNDKTQPIDRMASVTESNHKTQPMDRKASVTESNHKTYPMDQKASVTESNHKTYLMGQKASVTESNHKTYLMDKKASVTESNHKTYPMDRKASTRNKVEKGSTILESSSPTFTNPLTTVEPTTTTESDLIVHFRIRDHPDSKKGVLPTARSNIQGGITTPREIQTITPVQKRVPSAITRRTATTGIIPKKSISNILSITASKSKESFLKGNPRKKVTKQPVNTLLCFFAKLFTCVGKVFKKFYNCVFN